MVASVASASAAWQLVVLVLLANPSGQLAAPAGVIHQELSSNSRVGLRVFRNSPWLYGVDLKRTIDGQHEFFRLAKDKEDHHLQLTGYIFHLAGQVVNLTLLHEGTQDVKNTLRIYVKPPEQPQEQPQEQPVLKYLADAPLERARRQTGTRREISVNENVASGSFLFYAFSPTSSSERYIFKSPPPAKFTIDASTAQVFVKLGTKLDYDVESERIIDFTVLAQSADGTAVLRSQDFRILVQEVLDEKPEILRFAQSIYAVLYRQNETMDGAAVYQLQAQVPDNASAVIEYQFIPGMESRAEGRFRVVSDLGYVVTKLNDGYQPNRRYQLGVQAVNANNSNPLTKYGYAFVNVFTTYQNPQFSKNFYEFYVYEGVSVGTLVGTVACQAINNVWSIVALSSRMSSSVSSNFTMSSSGNITTVSELDYDLTNGRKVWYFTAVCVENATSPSARTAEAGVKINLVDIDDNRPLFALQYYVKSTPTPENVAVGTEVYRVPAYDADSKPNANLTFTLTGGNSSLFNVSTDPSTLEAVIRVTGVIDYEMLPNADKVAQFDISVTDGVSGTSVRPSATVIIPVQNVNDNSPTLGNFSAVIQRAASSGTVVLQLQAEDRDGSGINYYFWTGSATTLQYPSSSNIRLTIDQTSGIVRIGSAGFSTITEATYVVPIRVVDDGTCDGCPAGTALSSEIGYLTLTVQETNTAVPTFTNCPTTIAATGSVNYTEGQQIGTSLIQLNAVDPVGSSGSVIQYALVTNVLMASPGSFFQINSTSGLVTSSAVIDIESRTNDINKLKNYFWLTVRATNIFNSRSGYCSFRVVFDDINDSVPEFDDTTITRVVSNTASFGTVVGQVLAFDPDQYNTSASTVEYYLISTSPTVNFFSVSFANNIGSVVVANSLSAIPDKTRYELTIEARNPASTPLTTSLAWNRVTYIIYVTTDTSLLPPVVDVNPSDITIRVMENQTESSVVFSMNASRPDGAATNYEWYEPSGKFAQTNAGFQQHFVLRSSTSTDCSGNVCNMAVAKAFAFEDFNIFYLRARVSYETRDTTIGQIYTDVIRHIVLEDVNNNWPRYLTRDFITTNTLLETASPNTFITQAFAVDVDSLTPYKTVLYSFDNTTTPPDYRMFSIDSSTGVIRTASTAFDMEGNRTAYFLTVLAQDSAQSSLSGVVGPNKRSLAITVRLADANDNTPSFNNSIYYLTVREDAQIGFLVGTVTGSDRDSTDTLRYLITAGDTNYDFVTDVESGQIKVAKPLSYYRSPSYLLTYAVTDGTNTNTAQVNITVIDTNNNAPTFSPSAFINITNVTEGSPAQVIYRLGVIDKDTTTPTFSLAGTWVSPPYSLFTVNPSTGELSTTAPIDREQSPTGMFRFNALVADNGSPSRTGYAVVEVWPIDVNDNRPVWNESSLHGQLKDNSSAGTTFMQLRAIDPDTSGTLTFALVSGGTNASAYVTVNSDGSVSTTPTLGTADRENLPPLAPRGIFTFITTVTDGVGNPVTGTASVTIVDINDNPPVFNNSVYYVTVPETTEVGENIFTAAATDVDEIDDRQLNYSIINNYGYFTIANVFEVNGGAVILTKKLDYENASMPKTFNLVIQVIDSNPPPFTASCTLIITVADVNDNAPAISFSPNAAITRNEGFTGSTGLSFSASDADSADTRFNFSVLASSDPYGNIGLTGVTNTGGSISIAAALDREIWGPAANADAVHEYVILASDMRGLTGSATLTITIVDVSDTAAILKESYTVYIMENQPVGTVATPGPMFGDDKDKGAANGPFTFAADLSSGNNWTGKFSLSVVNSTAFNIVSAKTFDRETDGAVFLLQVTITDGSSLTGTGTVTVIIGDVDDNAPFSNGYKQVYAYIYEGNTDYWFNSSTRIQLGYAVVFDNDDWDRSSKTYVLENSTNYFELDSVGAVTMKGGTPGNNYTLIVRVTDPTNNVAWCRFVVTVTVLPYDALINSGSMLISGINADAFVRRLRVSGTESLGANSFPSFYFSVFDYIKLNLSNALGTEFHNTHIFYVASVGSNSVLIRYTASSSPYYYASRLSALVSLSQNVFNYTLGRYNASLTMLPIDACRIESDRPGGCIAGCKNSMIIRRRTPAAVIRNSTAVIGINVTITSTCDCRVRDTVVPDSCTADTCFNDGNCTDIPGSNTFTCACPDGFEGPRCEVLKVGFLTQGFLALSPFTGGCAHTHLSFYFITSQTASNVLLLYTGSFGVLATAAPTMMDFLALELINGKPKLTIELGSGASTGGLFNVSTAPALNDGSWHRIDIFLDLQVVVLKVDGCQNAPTKLDGDPTGPDLSSCQASWTIPGSSYMLNVASFALFVGGRYDMTNTLQYPTGLATTGFIGQVAKVRLNSLYYDLYVGKRSWHVNALNNYSPTNSSCAWSDGTPKCQNGWCWGVLNGAVGSGNCECHAGYRKDSNGRCTVDLGSVELKTSSYIGWKAKSSLMNSLKKQTIRLDIRFKTRQTTGTLLRASGSDPYRPEHMELVLSNSRLIYKHNMGDYVLRQVILPNANVSDGAWHWLRVTRSLRDVEILLDGGEAYNYIYKLGNITSNYNNIVLSDQVTAGAQLSTTSGTITIVPTSSDLQDTCISTVRINELWLPVNQALGSNADAAATVEQIVNVQEGCANGTPVACPAGFTCSSNLVCLPAWRPAAPVCGCAAGYTLYSGTCYAPVACMASNPCVRGTCSVVNGVTTCTCPTGWQGSTCAIPVVALGSAGLVVIILLLALFLLFLLAMLIWFCCCGATKGDGLLIDAPYENVVVYNEEGGGQEDKLSFDIAQLRVKLTEAVVTKQTVTKLQSSRTDFSSMLQGRLEVANAGPDPSPFDGVLDYEYEGRGAQADDLDSIVSADDNGPQDFEFLNSWGPKFQRVATVYTSFPDNADDLQSTADLDSVMGGPQTQHFTETVTTTSRRV